MKDSKIKTPVYRRQVMFGSLRLCYKRASEAYNHHVDLMHSMHRDGVKLSDREFYVQKVVELERQLFLLTQLLKRTCYRMHKDYKVNLPDPEKYLDEGDEFLES